MKKVVKVRKRKINLDKTAKRYARRVISDIKDDLLFGEELWNFIVASAKHDLSAVFQTEEMYYKIEDAVLDLYEKNTVKCNHCRCYIYKDYAYNKGEYHFCDECYKTVV